MTITLVPYAGLCNRILAGKIYGTLSLWKQNKNNNR